ncbi:MAG: prephenate dehydrogenase [Betaproteobacteria bacterium RIFCSPHIGHO2_12_FULL_69_13]|nr:MAG: prephenate dehydrogenase [Betaproteobacteria bacterium RIFCSPHIGHO2_12_FULL_69_13]OGA69779.1 MAG: prephenate dehydrogenase [Betaproteobacteria bacterium RIFCSPLOWO2_12_FULL_68_20]
MTPRFERVAVIGVGLIGGSFALALKQARACSHVVGVGRDPRNVRLALERGVVDSSETDPAAAARGADLILVATPVAQAGKVFASIAPALGADALVTDAGSTKCGVVAAARAALGEKLRQLVPAHPIAGGEHSGVAAASAQLFRGRRVVLVPLAENAPAAVERVSGAWQACGAKIARMEPEEHDAVFAAVSHLPHLLAYALVHELAGRENSAQLFSYAAGGFRDFTRIASSHPEMWRDICVANRDRLLAELARFAAKLESVRGLLQAGDAGALERLFAEARAARGRWLEGEYDA